MKISIILAVHDRIDDLDAHLDILDFAPPEWNKIIIWSHPQTPPDRIACWKRRVTEVIRIEGENFSIGPLLAFTAGLRASEKLNCDYCIYRNADDWLLNHKSVSDRIEAVSKNGMLFAGYNWLTSGNMKEFALNEATLHVKTFAPHVDSMDRYFFNSSIHMLCEFKLARWVNKLVDGSKFLRLLDRERSPGVGHDLTTLSYQESVNKNQFNLPEGWRDKWKYNHRFFHKGWQLIGSHSQKERYDLYKSIRNDVPYSLELEMKPEFRRWLLAAQKELAWNLPTTSNHMGGRKIPACLQRPVKRMPAFIPKN